MGSHAALIEELESAKEGSRELDIAVAEALRKDMLDLAEDDRTKAGQSRVGEGFKPTRNLQLAVDLVPEGWLWRLDGTNPTHPEADLWGPNWRTEHEQEYISCGAATPALALCVAILRAVEAKDG